MKVSFKSFKQVVNAITKSEPAKQAATAITRNTSPSLAAEAPKVRFKKYPATDVFEHSQTSVKTPKAGKKVSESIIKVDGKNITRPLKEGEKIKMTLDFTDATGKTKQANVIFSFIKHTGQEQVIVKIPDKKATIYAQINPKYANIKNGKDYVFIENMYSESFKGGGTLLHQAIAKRSKDLGYKGRVMLDAAWNSHLFHYKSGFRPANKSQLEELEELAQRAAEKGKRIRTDYLGSMTLFLTPRKAAKLMATKKTIMSS